MEVDRRRLLGDAGDRDPPALADHPDRLAHGVLRARGIDGDVGAKTGREFADASHRVAVVVVHSLEADILRSFEAFAATNDDAASAAERARAHRSEETHPADPDGHADVARIDPRPL